MPDISQILETLDKLERLASDLPAGCRAVDLILQLRLELIHQIQAAPDPRPGTFIS
jgi:hypothetical protein